MAKVSQDMHKEPIMGSHILPYRETGMRVLGLYPWWAFCMPAIGLSTNVYSWQHTRQKFKI
jgi:hypothetical protein